MPNSSARLSARPDDPSRRRPAAQTKRNGPAEVPGVQPPGSGALPTHNPYEGADMAESTRTPRGPHSATSHASVKITPLTGMAHTLAEPSTR